MEPRNQVSVSLRWVSFDQILSSKVSRFFPHGPTPNDFTALNLLLQCRYCSRHHGWYHRYLRACGVGPNIGQSLANHATVYRLYPTRCRTERRLSRSCSWVRTPSFLLSPSNFISFRRICINESNLTASPSVLSAMQVSVVQRSSLDSSSA